MPVGLDGQVRQGCGTAGRAATSSRGRTGASGPGLRWCADEGVERDRRGQADAELADHDDGGGDDDPAGGRWPGRTARRPSLRDRAPARGSLYRAGRGRGARKLSLRDLGGNAAARRDDRRGVAIPGWQAGRHRSERPPLPAFMAETVSWRLRRFPDRAWEAIRHYLESLPGPAWAVMEGTNSRWACLLLPGSARLP